MSKVERITANTKVKPEDGEPYDASASIDVTLPETMAEAAEMYGEDTAFDLFIRATVIKAQGAIRGLLQAGKGQEEIEQELANWRPDVVRRAKADPRAKALSAFEGLSKEEQMELLEQLRQRAMEAEDE